MPSIGTVGGPMSCCEIMMVRRAARIIAAIARSESLLLLVGSTIASRPTEMMVVSPAGAAAGGVTGPGHWSPIAPAFQRFAHTDQVVQVSHERLAQVHAHSSLAKR